MTKRQPAKLNLAHLPTPLVPLDRLSEQLGSARIWVKRDDLTHAAMSGNKLRKLEFVAAEALKRGAGVLITCGGIQSNHCRATALLCAQLGLACHLILRGDRPQVLDGNTLLADLAGAQMTFVPPIEYQNQLDHYFKSLVDDYQKKGVVAYCIPTGASDEVGLWGYYSMATELMEDFRRQAIDVSAVCCATGSGGTHSGLALGLHHSAFCGDVKGFAVCDDGPYFLQKGVSDMQAWYRTYFPDETPDLPKLVVDDGFIGAGYGVASDEVLHLIRKVASLEGVLLDPVYTGKAFLGMVKMLEIGVYKPSSNVVFIHTGGMFGLYPYRNKLAAI